MSSRGGIRIIGVATVVAILCGGGAGTGWARQGGAPSAAQSVEADEALAACAAAARKRGPAAREAAERAERLYAELIRREPSSPEPLVKLAQVKTRCRIPQADFMNQGRLLEESNALLEEALILDPGHWEARFSLAMNHYHTPAFLGRTGAAIRELERLLAQQGDSAGPPFHALPYVHLGDLYLRARRRADAIALWERGLGHFPENEALRARLVEHAGREPSGGRPEPDSATDHRDGAPVSSGAGGVGPPPVTEPGTGAEAGTDGPAQPRYALRAVVVQAGTYTMDDPRSGTVLRQMDIYTTPGATADPLHALQTLPGVTRASEGSDLYVRGGQPAESPVFVDGARLIYAGTFETLHGGLFGVLDPAILRRMTFSSGGFSVRYGDALSGMLDVETVGRPVVPTARVGLNLVQGSATANLPLGRRSGFWASGRASESSLLLRLRGETDVYPRAPRSVEATAGLVVEPTHSLELRAVGLVEEDGATRHVDAWGYAGPFRTRGGTRLALVSARSSAGPGAGVLRATAAFSERETGFVFGVLDRRRRDRALSVRAEGDWVRQEQRIRIGAEGRWLEAAEHGTVPATGTLEPGAPATDLGEWRESAGHAGAWVETELGLTNGLALVAGVRTDRLPAENGWSADPRFGLAYRSGDWTLRTGAGIFRQGRWRVEYTVPDAGRPIGAPTRAIHALAGAERLGEPALRFEAYLKEYDRYEVPPAPALADGDWHGPSATAGRAAGADAIVRWSEGRRLTGWISYSFLHSRISLDDDRRVPAGSDITHTATAVARLALGPRWQVGTTARYATGRPYTPVTGVTHPSQPGQRPVPVHGQTYGARLPDYARLDARVTHLVPLGQRLAVLYLETLNVLGRRNVMAVTHSGDEHEPQVIEAFFGRRTAVLGAELRL